MENPLTLPAPTEPLARAEAFARDLAYGASVGLWDVQVSAHARFGWYLDGDTAEELRAKWGDNRPSPQMLLTFEYITLIAEEGYNRYYRLTRAAFDLLRRPAAPPRIFISYRRSESSALALLVEARLRLAGNPNPFVDKNILAGDEWRAVLQNTIAAAEYFVLLAGPNTLASREVTQEIAWAREAGCRFISIWHNGADVPADGHAADVLALIRDRNAIRVQVESAEGYEQAVNKLLNSLGYPTY